LWGKKIIEYPYYKELASFIELVDKWFDLFNCSQKFDKKGQSCYGVNLLSQNITLDEMTSVMTDLRSIKRSSSLPFQKGIVISNKSLKGLYMYCYDLNFAVNRKGENVLEHSRTGSRTPTSGTGRVNSARGGENI
jgi:hypothetical protein